MENPILVTGAQWSGTTWLGDSLNKTKDTGIIYEPLNPLSNLGVCGSFKIRYKRIQSNREIKKISDALRFRYSIKRRIGLGREGIDEESIPWNEQNVKSKASAKDLLASIYHFLRSKKNKIFGKRPILKDPIALLSADKIVEEFNADIIITMRHPAAFVESAKRRLDRTVNALGQLKYCQEDVLREELTPFYKDVLSWQPNDELIDQICLLYNLLNYHAKNISNDYDKVKIVRHEDLVRETEKEFVNLFDFLDINYEMETISGIKDGVNDGTATKWKSRLNCEEKDKIKKLTEEVGDSHYGEFY